jgi:tetratricopeptide (TPR) repeat protein
MKYTYAAPFAFLLVLCACLILPVTADPTDAAGWYAAGENLTAQNNYTLALQAYDQAIALDPSFAAAWNGRADVLNRAHRYTQDPLATLNLALTASDKALALNATSVPFWINRGQILYNIGYYYKDTLGDKDTAAKYYNDQLAAFEKATALEPDNADAWFNRAYALCGMGRCSEGVEDFKRVQQLDPDYPHIQGNLENAEKLAAVQTPFYVKYAFGIVAGVIVIIGAALWYISVRKKY